MIRPRANPAKLLLLFGLVAGGALIGAATAAAQETGDMRDARFFSPTLGRDLEYLVYLPPELRTAADRHPVLYLLHGRGDRMQDWSRVAPLLDELIQAGTIPPVIAVAPDAAASSRAGYYVDSHYDAADAEALETAILGDLIPHVEASYPALSGRAGRFLVGYSMGGYGAIRYALGHSDRFSAALVLSPAVYTPLPPAQSSTREFGAFGVGARRFSEERYRELNYPALLEEFPGARTPLRFFIAVGDDEWKHPDPEEMMHDLDMEAHLFYSRASRVNGIDAEFRVYDGGHDWHVWERGLREGLRRFATDLRMAPFRASGSNAPAEPRTES